MKNIICDLLDNRIYFRIEHKKKNQHLEGFKLNTSWANTDVTYQRLNKESEDFVDS